MYISSIWWIHATLPKSSLEIFDIAREALFVYADMNRIQPRLLNQIIERFDGHQSLDSDIVFLASNSLDAERLAEQREGTSVSIIPLKLRELKLDDGRSIKKTLEQWLPVFDRYNVTRPLRRTDDLFGRKDELSEIEFSLRHGQSVGLFGLRKAGKTSILNAIQSTRTKNGSFVVQLDMSKFVNAAHFRKTIVEECWKSATTVLNKANKSTRTLHRDGFLRTLDTKGQATSDTNALIMGWLDDVMAIVDTVKLPLELIIDEIDTVFPGQSTQFLEHELQDFSVVMRQLRGLLQADGRQQPQAVLLCAGVNPAIFESSTTPDGRNNQLYKLVRLEFLKPLNYDDSSRMVRSLGSKMGVKYGGQETTESLYTYFGGHPMLTRQACSEICKLRPDGSFPWTVSLSEIDRVVSSKDIGSVYHQAKEIATQFTQWFPQEAELLRTLWGSNSEMRQFATEIVAEDNEALLHARAYGLIDPDSLSTARIGMITDVFSKP